MIITSRTEFVKIYSSNPGLKSLLHLNTDASTITTMVMSIRMLANSVG